MSYVFLVPGIILILAGICAIVRPTSTLPLYLKYLPALAIFSGVCSIWYFLASTTPVYNNPSASVYKEELGLVVVQIRGREVRDCKLINVQAYELEDKEDSDSKKLNVFFGSTDIKNNQFLFSDPLTLGAFAIQSPYSPNSQMVVKLIHRCAFGFVVSSTLYVEQLNTNLPPLPTPSH